MSEPVRQAFSRAAAKPEGSSGNDFLEAILLERADLKDKTAYFPSQGANAHTVIIGDEVFKGPVDSWAVEGFDEEHKILKAMEGKGIPVPKVTCVGADTIFFGMTRMKGVKLGVNFEERLTLDQQRALAKDIADFVVDMARAVPPREGRFAAHADLHDGNIMIDPETKRLSAIIDFGIVRYRQKGCLCLYIGDGSGSFCDMLKEEYALQKQKIPDPPSVKKQFSPEGLAT